MFSCYMYSTVIIINNDLIILSPEILGLASRSCQNSTTPAWDIPNFTACISAKFNTLQNKVSTYR